MQRVDNVRTISARNHHVETVNKTKVKSDFYPYVDFIIYRTGDIQLNCVINVYILRITVAT